MLQSIVSRALQKSANTDNVIPPHFIALSLLAFIFKSKVAWNCSSDMQIDIMI